MEIIARKIKLYELLRRNSAEQVFEEILNIYFNDESPESEEFNKDVFLKTWDELINFEINSENCCFGLSNCIDSGGCCDLIFIEDNCAYGWIQKIDEEIFIDYCSWEYLINLEIQFDSDKKESEVLAIILLTIAFSGYISDLALNTSKEIQKIIQEIEKKNDFYLIQKKQIEPIIFKLYSLGEITTEKASNLFDISGSKFVDLYEGWKN